jgi:3-deoxy-D-manno-octulosonate 8-phosphate phosphatase (KDO 8-P phosphatase)
MSDEPFRSAGGDFVASPAVLSEKLAGVHALVFDWDGVFNVGGKGASGGGGFSEPDSMGVNLLRYGFWRRDRRLPVTAIVSGEQTLDALQFAEREHLQATYVGVRDKRVALRHLCDAHGIEPDAVALVFDDVNDLGMAADCGVRCLVRRSASPLLREHVTHHGLCEYVTANDGSSHAVREIAEMFLGLMGVYDEVVASRAAFDFEYQTYFEARQSCATTRHGADGARIVTA